MEDGRWRDAATVQCNANYLRQRTRLSEQRSYSFGLSLIANEPIIDEYRLTRSHLPSAWVKEADTGFWLAFMRLVALDRTGGVWLRTLLKRYRRDIPPEVFNELIQDVKCQALALEMIQSLYSGFGWQAELGATEPAEFAVMFIEAAGRAGANGFANVDQQDPSPAKTGESGAGQIHYCHVTGACSIMFVGQLTCRIAERLDRHWSDIRCTAARWLGRNCRTMRADGEVPCVSRKSLETWNRRFQASPHHD
jgi:hypothetical protein